MFVVFCFMALFCLLSLSRASGSIMYWFKICEMGSLLFLPWLAALIELTASVDDFIGLSIVPPRVLPN